MKDLILAKEFEGALWILAKDHQAALQQQAAVIEQMREALHRCTKFTQEDYDAIELQPCPEVLNKVRADAVRKFADWGICDKGSILYVAAEAYADRVEKGEA